jgi:hypothetical protein
MNAIKWSVSAAVVVIASTVATPAAAQREPGLDQLDCRTLLKLGGDERDYTLLYLHGFVSGKNGELNVPAQALAEATDRVIEHCIDRPGDKLLQVFEQMRKKK